MEDGSLSKNFDNPSSLGNYKDVSQVRMVDDIVLPSLRDDKANNIVVYDVEGKTSIADKIVIASGRSKRHVASMADHLIRSLKKVNLKHSAKVEGLPNADWVLIDAGDVVIHIFRPEVREFYDLDRLWQDMIDTD